MSVRPVEAQINRVMLGLDITMLDGVGSGRTPEEQLAALRDLPNVIDADVLDDEYDDDDAYDDDLGLIPGGFVDGRFVALRQYSPWTTFEDDPGYSEPDTYNQSPVARSFSVT
jgi:hypothetical protein